MVRSRRRYSRARIRARVRRPRRRGGSNWFYGTLAVIVVVGIALIVFVRSDTGSADVPPQPGNPTTGAPGDHWHAAIAVNVCGEWLDAPPTFENTADNPNVRAGIHTHGDGFVHIHPFTKSEGGDNATLDRFLTYGGWSASEDSLDLWAGPSSKPTKKSWSDGDQCPAGSPDAGQRGEVKWSLDCQPRSGDPSDLKLRNGTVVALGFRPRGVDIGVPPNADSTPTNDGSQAAPLSTKCSTSGPGGTGTTTTTVPAATTP